MELDIGGKRTVFLDTPGFDDTKRPAAEVLEEISEALTFQYESGMQLRGIIYLHRITDVKYSGSAIHTFNILRKICGPDALQNVLLVTNRWAEANSLDPTIAIKREHQLREEFWPYMLDHGSTMCRFHATRDSAVALVSRLLSKDPVVLALQHEISIQEMRLADTTAGSFVHEGLVELQAKCKSELDDLQSYQTELGPGQLGRPKQQRLACDIEGKQGQLLLAKQQVRKLDQNISHKIRHAFGKLHLDKNGRQTVANITAVVGPMIGLVTAILTAVGKIQGW